MAAAYGGLLGTGVSDGSLATTNTVSGVTAPSGSVLVACAHWYTDGGVSGTATFSGGSLTWSDAVDLGPADEAGRRVSISVAQCPSGITSQTITATFDPPGGGYNRYLDVHYVTGVAASAVVDAVSAIGNGTAAAWASGNLVTTVANALLFATGWVDFRTTDSTPATNYSEAADYATGTAGITVSSVYRVVNSTGTYTPGGTWGAGHSGQEWVAVAVALKEASATTADLTGTTVGAGGATGALSAGVTHMGSGAAVTAASGNVTASYPSGVVPVANDVIVCDVTAHDNVTCTFPAGWTKKVELNNGTSLRKTIAWKRYAGGDTDTNVLVTHSSGDRIVARAHLIRGATTTGDPFEVEGGPTAVSAATTGTFPNATTLTPGSMLFYAMGYQDDYGSVPSITNAQGLTLTERGLTEVP